MSALPPKADIADPAHKPIALRPAQRACREIRPAGSNTRILPTAIRETYINEHRERRYRDHAGLIEVSAYEMPTPK